MLKYFVEAPLTTIKPEAILGHTEDSAVTTGVIYQGAYPEIFESTGSMLSRCEKLMVALAENAPKDGCEIFRLKMRGGDEVGVVAIHKKGKNIAVVLKSMWTLKQHLYYCGNVAGMPEVIEGELFEHHFKLFE